MGNMLETSLPSPLIKRIPGLDGMRGLAIITVIGFHANTPYFGGGFIGVEVFFVLSGFLITSLIVMEWQRSGTVNLWNFYLRRILRLMPALLLLLLTFVIGGSIALAVEAPVALPYSDINKIWTEAALVLFGLSNWARALGYSSVLLLGHTWSLAIEWQFYFVWPPLLLILLKAKKSPNALITTILLIALVSWLLRVIALKNGASYPRLYNGFDFRLDSLLIGCAVGVAFGFNLIPRGAHKMTNPGIVISFLALAGFSVFAEWKTPFMYYLGFPVVSLITATIILYLIVHASKNGAVTKALEVAWLRGLGVISYGVYLWHYPILRTLETRHWPLPITLMATILLTLAIAITSYRLVEKPMLKLKSIAL